MQTRQYIELFHLVFLDHLGRKTDKQAWALKGGCNLRFFFGSVRYSEDIDFDVMSIHPHVLRDRVNAILTSRPFSDVLAVRGMRVEHATEAKQTETTQRWELGLTMPDAAMPLPCKVEFSRRGMAEGIRFDPVAPELIREYELTPILASHYDAASAAIQKLHALVSRSVVQARDLFDLNVLLTRIPEPTVLRLPKGIPMARIEERAMAIGFDVFRSQVLSFMPADVQARYADGATWDTLVLRTLDMLRSKLQCD